MNDYDFVEAGTDVSAGDVVMRRGFRPAGQHRNGAREPEFITVPRGDYRHPTVKKAKKRDTRKANKAAKKSRARNR